MGSGASIVRHLVIWSPAGWGPFPLRGTALLKQMPLARGRASAGLMAYGAQRKKTGRGQSWSIRFGCRCWH